MQNNLKLASFIAHSLDNRFNILGVKFGLNAFLELVPGFGDAIAALLSAYIIYLGYRSKAPQAILSKMIWNVSVAFVVGLLPFVGDAFYIFYKPNIRNVELLNNFFDRDYSSKEIPDLPLAK